VLSSGRSIILIALLVAVATPFGAGRQVAEKIDLDAIARIEQEGLERSQILETTSYLTDVFGARLTGSTNAKDAAEWTEQRMRTWGLSNVHLETWPFGQGWENRRFFATVVSPRPFPLIGFPKAWTPGTDGSITGDAVLAPIQSDGDFESFKGRLRGRFVLTTKPREVAAHFDAPARRFSDGDLAALAAPRAAAGRGRANLGNQSQQQALARRRTQFWRDEGVAAVVEPSSGDGGTFFVQAGGSPDPKAPAVVPQVVLAVEHYGRIARMLQKNIPVTMQMDIDNRFLDDDLNSFNILGEIPGTDRVDELVMIGAHFDSWHAGTGATDNAAGAAVMLEAMRILKAAGLTMRRTVRIALWTGEEQGLLGSRAYVRAHFADPATMSLLPEHAQLSTYFNLDNGTGAIRGVYLQGNEMAGPIFSSWMEPLKRLGVTTVAVRNTGGTDHASFDAVGLPGFQFIQDPIEYDARTHHSNMDVYERVQAADLMRNAVIVAAFVYDASNRDEKLPRKPLPLPQQRQPNQ
jgi:hypothetical protein